MNRILVKIKELLNRNVLYCDVGARWGISEPWKSYRNIIDVVSFEPDPEEFESLREKNSASDKIYPYALYKKDETILLNLTKSRGCSSIYVPNDEFLNNYPDYARFTIEKKISARATTLDNLNKCGSLSHLDFIKLDVQGAELDILQGGEKFLKENIIGMEVEVEFHQMYKGQPLFSDIDPFVRNQLGLELQDLRKTYWKYSDGINVGAKKGQLIFGDALYLRSPHKILEWSSRFTVENASEKVQSAIILGIIYGYLDYSLCILNQPRIGEFLNEEKIKRLKMLISICNRKISVGGIVARKFSFLLHLVYKIFQPTHDGWATSDPHLGSRKMMGIFH